ncbi:OmpH family outer membrane protein [Roseicyclus sp. F158]|uniref:OmpH family outer membrane protein n=1 Tax=Tropicimonas omnivorans TaxID=3075590 RepID=A0ABU3DJV1_9RHOB|nr:OmpH family outer membrane protein [Roseicyclus sp. F158]MDT0683993.1 OmpH family outer membrane protein [Roseicyclus sp. F158]
MGRRLTAGAALVAAACLPLAAAAQEGEAAIPRPQQGPLQDQTVVIAPFLTLDQDELFDESLYGQRIEAEIEDASAALAEENREIEEELTAEEQRLTELRSQLDADEFRRLADAFDAKVVDLRRRQDTKTRTLQARRDQERQAFLQRILPVLSELVRESGAVAILDSRAVFLSSESIDVTDAARRRIDRDLGDGADLPPVTGDVPKSGDSLDPPPQAEEPSRIELPARSAD